MRSRLGKAARQGWSPHAIMRFPNESSCLVSFKVHCSGSAGSDCLFGAARPRAIPASRSSGRASSSTSGWPTGVSREEAQKDIETIAREVLANPVIEEYPFEFFD